MATNLPQEGAAAAQGAPGQPLLAGGVARGWVMPPGTNPRIAEMVRAAMDMPRIGSGVMTLSQRFGRARAIIQASRPTNREERRFRDQALRVLRRIQDDTEIDVVVDRQPLQNGPIPPNQQERAPVQVVRALGPPPLGLSQAVAALAPADITLTVPTDDGNPLPALAMDELIVDRIMDMLNERPGTRPRDVAWEAALDTVAALRQQLARLRTETRATIAAVRGEMADWVRPDPPRLPPPSEVVLNTAPQASDAQDTCPLCMTHYAQLAVTVDGRTTYCIRRWQNCGHWVCDGCFEHGITQRYVAGERNAPRVSFENCHLCRGLTGYIAPLTPEQRVEYYEVWVQEDEDYGTRDPYAGVQLPVFDQGRIMTGEARDGHTQTYHTGTRAIEVQTEAVEGVEIATVVYVNPTDVAEPLNDIAPDVRVRFVDEDGDLPMYPGDPMAGALLSGEFDIAPANAEMDDQMRALIANAGYSNGAGVVRPIHAMRDARGRMELLAARVGEDGATSMAAIGGRILATVAPPVSTMGLMIDFPQGYRLIMPRETHPSLRPARPYTPGAYGDYIDMGANPGRTNPHEVLHAQRRQWYMWLMELSANIPDTYIVEYGGRPDIVENMPRSNVGTAAVCGQWYYGCPLIMPEDMRRERVTARYVTSGVACRCMWPRDRHTARMDCAVCGTANPRRAAGELPLYALMHTAYYFTPEMLCRMCQDGRGVIVFTHVYPEFEGKAAFTRGTNAEIVESTWARLGTTVTVNVMGNPDTYRHDAMNWLRESCAFDDGVDSAMRWYHVGCIGDLSPGADPSSDCPGATHAYHFVACTRNDAREMLRHIDGYAENDRLGNTDGTVTRSDEQYAYEYTRQGDMIQIVARHHVNQNMVRVVTVPWAAFDKVLCIGPAADPAATARPMGSRIRLHMPGVDITVTLMAIEAYLRPELEEYSIHRLVQLPEVQAISDRLAGRAPRNDGWVTGVVFGIATLAATHEIPLAMIVGYGAKLVHGEFRIFTTYGYESWLARNRVSREHAAIFGIAMAYMGKFAIRVAARRALAAAPDVDAMGGAATAWINTALAKLTWPTRVEEITEEIDTLDVLSPIMQMGWACWDTLVKKRTFYENLRHQVVEYIYPSRGDEFWPVMAGDIRQPKASRPMTWTDVSRRGYWLAWRVGLHFIIPDQAQMVLALLTAVDPVEGTHLTNRGLSESVAHIGFEELLKDKLDYLCRWFYALWLNRGRMPNRYALPPIRWKPGHWAFAVFEFAAKLTMLPRIAAGGRVQYAIMAAAPVLMHVGIARLPRAQRELIHTMWNFAFLSVQVQGRSRVINGDFARMVYCQGMGVYQTLKIGNYLAGAGIDELGEVWKRRPMRSTATMRMPNEKADYRPAPKPLMVMGPLPNDPQYPFMVAIAWTKENEERSIANRVVMETGLPIDAGYFNGVFAPMFREMHDVWFDGLQVDAMRINDWLKTFKPSRRKELADAFDKWMLDAWVNMPYVGPIKNLGQRFTSRTRQYDALDKTAMLKAEQTKNDADPRAIQMSKPVILVAGGPWFASLAAEMSKIGDGSRQYRGVHIIYGIGRTKSECYRIFFRLAHAGEKVVMVTGDDMLVCDGHRCYSIDASRWDAHTRRELLELGNDIWEKLGADPLIVHLCRCALARRGYTLSGIYYEVDGNTASGDCDTIQKNCVCNAPIAVVALLTCDDLAGPVIDGRAPFARKLHEVATKVGIKYEFINEEGVLLNDYASYHDLEFCSAYPVLAADGEWVASPKLGRVIARFGLCTPGHLPDVMLRSKALSLKAEAPHSSLLTLWAERAYASAGPGRLAEMGEHDLGRRRYTERMSDCDTLQVDDEHEQGVVLLRYGYTRQELADAINRVWDRFDRGVVEFEEHSLLAAVFRDN